MSVTHLSISKFIKKHIKDTFAIGCDPYTIDEEYSLQSQMVDEIIECMNDEGWKNAEDNRELIIEIIYDFRDDLEKIERLLSL